MSLSLSAHAEDSSKQFVGFTNLQSFSQVKEGETWICTSPEFDARAPWNELILSWNARHTNHQGLRAEARAIWSDHASRFYTLGIWSSDPASHPRESVNGQKDDDGKVATDTLELRKPATRWQVRLTLDGGATAASIAFLGVSLADTSRAGAAAWTNRLAWGQSLEVPRKSQVDYPGGAQSWCSPTSLSMVLNYWSQRLNRPDLAWDVPEVVKGVFDPQWPGTGNWPFNTALAGWFPGMRAYVTRLDDVSELEGWIAAGIPVVASVSYDRLQGRTTIGNGHLIVVSGFTESGDVVVNDPGTRLSNVRRTFARSRFVQGWAVSKNTVYVIHPEATPAPADPRGHWFSP